MNRFDEALIESQSEVSEREELDDENESLIIIQPMAESEVETGFIKAQARTERSQPMLGSKRQV